MLWMMPLYCVCFCCGFLCTHSKHAFRNKHQQAAGGAVRKEGGRVVAFNIYLAIRFVLVL